MFGVLPDGIHIVIQAAVIAFALYGLIIALGGLLNKLQGRGSGKPFVSILLVTSNDESSIEGMVRWLLNLNYCNEAGLPHYEVVVADDRSRDQTVAIVERLARESPLLRVVRAREGESAYEKGLTLCKGEVICLLDLKKRPATRSVSQVVAGLFG